MSEIENYGDNNDSLKITLNFNGDKFTFEKKGKNAYPFYVEILEKVKERKVIE